MITDEILELQKIVNEQLKNISESESEKAKKYFYNEYLRLSKILREKEDEFADWLANRAI